MHDANDSRRTDGREDGHPSDARDGRARTSGVALMLAVVFLLALAFGYQGGRDFAHKANRADCVAAGGLDCAAIGRGR